MWNATHYDINFRTKYMLYLVTAYIYIFVKFVEVDLYDLCHLVMVGDRNIGDPCNVYVHTRIYIYIQLD